MKHRMKGRKLGRTPAHRKATLRNLAIALLTHEQITTTLSKAKALQPYVEHLIHVAKQGTLHARRQVIQSIGDPIAVTHEDDDELVRNRYGEIISGPRVVKKLIDQIAPRYSDRQGGYTRIIKLAQHRIGDGSDLCVIQLVGGESEQGPQVAGQHSRRREQANNRMAYAAQLRKGQNVEAEASASATATVEESQGQQPDVSESAEGSRAEAGSASEQHQASQDEAEPRPGSTAEGDKSPGTEGETDSGEKKQGE